jgi:phosphate transport system protein
MTEVAQRKALALGLDRLNENMRNLAELSELAIRKAVDSLQHVSEAEAKEVFEVDNAMYSLQLVIERNCVDLIALHAPVARDLRTITTSLKISTDFDRIGRYSKDIAEISLKVGTESPTLPEKLGNLTRMADLTIHMVDTSIRAFVNRDADSVRDMGKFDDAVDDLHDELFEELVKLMENHVLRVSQGAEYILVNRYLERIADHAVNVGDRVVYMMTGEQPRHAAPYFKKVDPDGKNDSNLT